MSVPVVSAPSSTYTSDGAQQNKVNSAKRGRKASERRVARSVIAHPAADSSSIATPPSLPVPNEQQDARFWLWDTTKSVAASLSGVFKSDASCSTQQDEEARKASLLVDATQRAVKAREQERKDTGDSPETKKPPANIRQFLHRVGIMEIRYIRMLASLCSLTYDMSRDVTDKSLFRRHGLSLVTTSLIFERMVKETPRTVYNAVEEADGMAASQQTVATAYDDLYKSSDNDSPPAMEAIEKLKQKDRLDHFPTPSEILGARLSIAASAVTSAAAPLASNLSWAASQAVNVTVAPLQSIGAQLQSAATIGQSTALATIATVTAALDSTWNRKQVTTKQAISSSYWFVADDAKANTRFFVIQGSNNIDHWRINLQFDPVTFEDPSLGLKVHRGFYEAAKVLYDQFLPLVEEHLASSPFSKIVFTGHSLGGSVSTLLMLMFLHRRIIPAHALGPLYTFGAPAIFCETLPPQATAEQANRAASPAVESLRVSSKPILETVLDRMGLNSGAIRNVMFHRDIVPRSFSCDYELVSDLLAHVSDSFKYLECLRDIRRQVMYYHLGRTLVLQPDDQQKFVYGRTDHPMLPAGPNLYALRDSASLQEAQQQKHQSLSASLQGVGITARHLNNIVEQTAPRPKLTPDQNGAHSPEPETRRTGEANLCPDGTNIDDNAPDRQGGAELGSAAGSVAEAYAALMDTPHPLDILGEPGSYGPWGAISRYHDPYNYCKALGGVLRSRTQPWRIQQTDVSNSAQLPKVDSISSVRQSKQKRKGERPEPSLRSLERENLPVYSWHTGEQ